jgi:lipopolysaccharide/colanic/teichoic acid biosynthesis glycosyltransferase
MIGVHVISLQPSHSSGGADVPRVLRAIGPGSRMIHTLMHGFRKHYSGIYGSDTLFAMPQVFTAGPAESFAACSSDGQAVLPRTSQALKGSWILVSDGKRMTSVGSALIRELLDKSLADVVFVNVDPSLKSNREIVRTTSQGEVLGIRRAFFDSIVPDNFPNDWPNHTFVRASLLRGMHGELQMPLQFELFIKWCRDSQVKAQSVRVGGAAIDLESETGLLHFMLACMSASNVPFHKGRLQKGNNGWLPANESIAPSARFFGQVLIGENVQIEEDVLVAGPAFIGDGVRLGRGASVYGSLLCHGAIVQPGARIIRRVYEDVSTFAESDSAPSCSASDDSGQSQGDEICIDYTAEDHFRYWPFLSYARFGKRICDVVISSCALLAVSPVCVPVAIAIKLSSPGPVFFRHRREGLHGVEFNCLKFRTMITGAQDIQDRLRSKNEVDGPQFKVGKDPRVTRIGRLLRETYFDEVPQFANVFMGHMSVIGPRPSPRNENRLCVYWREARLSVKPGISGLWQVSRTRRKGLDFQEWIHFDVEYVKHMSLWQDIVICARTVRILAGAIIRRL